MRPVSQLVLQNTEVSLFVQFSSACVFSQEAAPSASKKTQENLLRLISSLAEDDKEGILAAKVSAFTLMCIHGC